MVAGDEKYALVEGSHLLFRAQHNMPIVQNTQNGREAIYYSVLLVELRLSKQNFSVES